VGAGAEDAGAGDHFREEDVRRVVDTGAVVEVDEGVTSAGLVWAT
jgi:hypothetical protein